MSVFHASSSYSVSFTGMWKSEVLHFLPFYFLSHSVVSIFKIFFFFKAFKNSSSRTEAQNTLNPSVVYLVNYRYPVKQIGMASLLLALAGYASLLLSLSVLLLFIFFCCPFGLILVVPMQTLLKASFLNVTRTHNKTPIITLWEVTGI